jgi:cell division protein FtsW
MFSRRKARIVFRADWMLLAIMLVLLLIGLIMIYSASYHFALYDGFLYERPAYFLQRQIVFAFIGFLCLIVFSFLDYHVYITRATKILLLTLGVLFFMAFFGRWIGKGIGGLSSVQPSEIAKIGAIIYMAVWLATREDQVRSLKFGIVPFATILGLVAGLIVAQPNFSTALLLVATAIAMLVVAGADTKQLLLMFFIGGMVVIAVALAAQYRNDRIAQWFRGPLSDPQGKGYQVVQALIALNKGGWFGVGLGQSGQKESIFAPHTDGMLAIIGEELGIMGPLLIITLYALFAWRGLRIAWHASDTYGMLLAVGLVAWIIFQAILHTGVITASVPFTGTVLPFVSYGGSSLVSGLIAVGILLNISRTGQASEQGRDA